MVYWIGYYLFHLFRFIWFPCQIHGLENIPSHGGVIFASNHNSNLDPFIIGIIPKREVYFFAKKELFKNPVLAWLMREWHAFPVDRSRADIGALKTSIRYLREGSPLVFFPEGTRGGGADGKTFPGIGFLVSKTRVPVIPVYIEGSERCLPPRAKFPRRTAVSVFFGKPMFFPETVSYEEISTRVMQGIITLNPV
ncbi:MAG: lysophospholipid acyltransferase family protein [Candidatus Omnitrophota bacterium]